MYIYKIKNLDEYHTWSKCHHSYNFCHHLWLHLENNKNKKKSSN